MSNGLITPAQNGAIDLYINGGGSTDAFIDLAGYFAPYDGTANGLALNSIIPCRAMSLAVSALSTTNLFQSGNACAISRAQAYATNSTVDPGGQVFGYLTQWPANGQPPPVVSLLNAVEGQPISNGAIVPALSGDVSFFVTESANLTVEIFGYFVLWQAGAATGGSQLTNQRVNGNSGWNYGMEAIYDAGTWRYWWGCGTSSTDMAICYKASTSSDPNAGGSVTRVIRIGSGNEAFHLCDIANPSVVRFGGKWIMYVEGVPFGDPGCPTSAPPGFNTAIYAFESTTLTSWTRLAGSSQPVIRTLDYGLNPPAPPPSPNPCGGLCKYGLGHPSAIVVNRDYQCTVDSSGPLLTSTAQPQIRLFYTSFPSGGGIYDCPICAPGNRWDFHIFEMRSLDGATFSLVQSSLGEYPVLSKEAFPPEGTPGSTWYGAWWPSVKKIGSWDGGDFPLAISFLSNGYQGTAVSRNHSEFVWRRGNGGGAVLTSPASGSTPRLASTPDGTLVDINGSPLAQSSNSQTYLRWSLAGTTPNSTYAGIFDALKWFPGYRGQPEPCNTWPF
jgi:hypothetical protein